MSIGIGIENLMNDNINNVDNTDASIQEYELEAQDAELAMLEAEIELVELESAEDMLNIDFTILKNAQKCIEEWGICKGFVQLADPAGILRNYKILPAIDDLNDVPTKDEYAEIATEGIKEMLSKAFEAIKNFFKKIGRFLAKLFGALINSTKSREKLIVALEKKLDKTTNDVDNDKWKKKKITALNKEFTNEIRNIQNAVGGVAGSLTKIIKDCTKQINIPTDESDLIAKAVGRVNVVMGSKEMTTILSNNLMASPSDVEKAIKDDGSYKKKGDLTKAGQFLIGKKSAELVISKSSVSLNFSDSVSDRFDKVDASDRVSAGNAKREATNRIADVKETIKSLYKFDQIKDLADKSLKIVVDVEKQASKFEDDKKKQNLAIKMAQIVRDVDRIYVKACTSISKTASQMVNMNIGFVKAVLACIEED